MGKAKAKELIKMSDAKSGCMRPCCNKDPKRVPHDKVWQFSIKNPGIDPFRE